jgi:hypothetical protein
VNSKGGARATLAPVATFGRVLAQAIAAREWALRDAAQRLGVSHSLLGMIIAGTRRPPLDRIVAWRGPLKLERHELERFVELALIAHGCRDLARMVRELVDEAQAYRPRTRVAEPHDPRP